MKSLNFFSFAATYRLCTLFLARVETGEKQTKEGRFGGQGDTDRQTGRERERERKFAFCVFFPLSLKNGSKVFVGVSIVVVSVAVVIQYNFIAK